MIFGTLNRPMVKTKPDRKKKYFLPLFIPLDISHSPLKLRSIANPSGLISIHLSLGIGNARKISIAKTAVLVFAKPLVKIKSTAPERI
jgi:hypothetical protein